MLKKIPDLPNGYTNYRPHQEEGIMEIIDALESGYQDIILRAEVGSGKSLIATQVARYVNQAYNHTTMITTESKYLQDQYVKDFPFIRTAKGRNTFECLSDISQHCDKGSCVYIEGFRCPYGVQYEDGKPSLIENDELDCLYWTQKIDAMNAQICLLNNAYALADHSFVKHFKTRNLLIIDEAHSIEESMMAFMEETLSLKQINKDIGFSIKKPNSTSMLYFAEQIEDISAAYETEAKIQDNDMKKKRFKDRAKSLQVLSEWLYEDPDNFIRIVDNDSIVFKPITVDKFANDLFLSLGEQRLYMSGSILKEDIFLENLGITGDYKVIDIPPVIPPENRPIFLDFVGSMSKKNIEATLPLMVAKIRSIAYSDKHKNQKGVIHTYTYPIANKLKKYFKDDDRFVFHSSHDRNMKINEFKHDDGNKILVSPYAYTGVNFPYDECRFAIVVKNPYPNIGDAQIQARENLSRNKYKGFAYVYQKRSAVLSQIYGRGVRAADDYCDLYLLDKDINGLLGKTSLLTTYFWEGLVDNDANREIRIIDRNRLSPDKRKSYEFERQIETSILNAIEDEGLNTLTKLRDAYKRLKGPSYTLVLPAFQRLLKNKAIELI